MNLKWVIIGTILVVLLVAFGRNPAQEAREQRRKEIEEKGILAYEIEKHLEEQKNAFGGMGQGSLMNQRRTLTLPQGTPGATDPALPAPADPTAVPTPQGYYPPPPLPENNAPVFDPSAPRSERSSDQIKRLSETMQVEYNATKVFVRTPDGKQHPLPDGRYLFDNGRFMMVVVGGERTRIMAQLTR
jgi:hypothetical protein